jgi:hypothetical protein
MDSFCTKRLALFDRKHNAGEPSAASLTFSAKEAWWKEAKVAIEDFWNHNSSEYQRAMEEVDEKSVTVVKYGSTSKQSYVLNQIRDTFYDLVDRYVAREDLKGIDRE